MVADFSSGPAGQRFPPTRRSAVLGVGSDDPVARARSFDVLVRAYWKPVYAHVRARWKQAPEHARDLTQGFFTKAFEKRYFVDYDPAKALFRTYLRACLDRFVMDDLRDERRLKRGGGVMRLSLDFESAEGELQRLGQLESEPGDGSFDSAWTRHLLGSALEALRDRAADCGKTVCVQLFEQQALADGPRPSYAQLGAEHALPVSQVTNYLAWARREFRRLVLDELRAITATEEEYRAEARALLGVEP